MVKKTYKTRVSLCTPTFNRRPFIKFMIDNISKQKYPKDLIEWIIIDDGTDPIGDLVKDIPYVKYFYINERMNLGVKRNLMHEKCEYKNDDDIIIYIDDDDYYPPERISHSVTALNNSTALCAGSSELFLWFNELNKMYKFGPYGKNHATAGTFAFKRKLLKITKYEDNALLAEEKYFLKDYTIPFVQLDPLKTILVIAHSQNTFDKKKLINLSSYCSESNLTINNFIKEENVLKFYSNLDTILNNYSYGDISNKPDVINEIKRRDEERKNSNREMIITDQNGNKRTLNMNEVINLYEYKCKEIEILKKEIKSLNEDNYILNEKNKYDKSSKIIKDLAQLIKEEIGINKIEF